MVNISKERREQRLLTTSGAIMTRRQYNMVLCRVLLYGLVANLIICAYFGDAAVTVNPVAFLIGYLICALIGCAMSVFSANPFISFIGYNLVVLPSGFVVSMAVQEYGGLGSEVVIQAFLITLCITATMTLLAVAFPEFCSKLGGILFASLLGLLIAELILMILGRQNIVTSWIGTVIFSLYIAYDVWRSQKFPPTLDNAVDSALDIYLDIANLFLELLEIFGKYKDD